MAERRGISWDKLKGSVQNDITLEEVVRSGPEYIPPRACFRVQCDNIEFIRQNAPLWNFITLNGYNLREFGSSAVMEMAVAFANAMRPSKTCKNADMTADWIAERLAFFWSIGNDFFEEVAPYPRRPAPLAANHGIPVQGPPIPAPPGCAAMCRLPA